MTVANPCSIFPACRASEAIRPEHVAPALDVLLAEAEAAVSAAEQVQPVRWETFVTPLDDATERLWRAWGLVGHLQGVVNTPELREAYNSNLPRVTRFASALGQNLALYRQYQALASPEAAHFDEAQRKVLDNTCATSAWAAPSWRPRPSSVLLRSRKNCRRCRRSSRRTCSTLPMPGR